MRYVTEAEVARTLTPARALDAAREAMLALAHGTVEMPERHALGADGGAYLVMPASSAEAGLGTKLVTVHAGNAARGLPTIHSLYVLQSAQTGETLAVIEARTLTERRTAATSALAARLLAPPDARVLGVLGAGPQAYAQAEAHLHVHPYRQVLIWNRTPEGARTFVRTLREAGHDAQMVRSPTELAHRADVLSAATRAAEPLIQGARLRGAQHLDLVGAFRPDMREADVAAVRRALVVVDQERAARAGAGDLLQAECEGWPWQVVELPRLVAGTASVARSGVTLFKSVGLGALDLFAARAVLRALDL
ncbi:ornithine cyclodeaminase family protein [Deinococcus peraridilitoris]|uniref:Putative ornithine cyclodeaminase, mu-crystallin n=1 Tax=Deinococcus peraridilitoris (strain DSM 19664 / LMG 22246 / CIP 109416 / KR-200) TaxID=937777 RepID=L0A0E8_DEIPD|nr:ornithine cyclodeaminase [Deinococcus peraridilitoris]AFZ66622.1 putative ornithine cyclodeaminase, mu-crystallin [Deinococcus peraridilitoris DSM 19664]